MDNDHRIFRLHVSYGAGILVTIIIILVTVEWGGITDLVQYINFALTLSSLVLALLAIVYAFLANASFAGHAGQLSEASSQIKSSAAALSAATDQLSAKVDSIPAALQSMGKQLEEARMAVVSLAEKPVQKPAVAQPNVVEDSAAVIKLLDASSLGGLFALYIALRSLQLKKPFRPSAFQKVRFVEGPYSHGFLIALASAGFIRIAYEGDRALQFVKLPSAVTEKALRDRIGGSALRIDKELVEEGLKSSVSGGLAEIFAAIESHLAGPSQVASDAEAKPIAFDPDP